MCINQSDFLVSLIIQFLYSSPTWSLSPHCALIIYHAILKWDKMRHLLSVNAL